MTLPTYSAPSAAALVTLHEQQLRAFLPVWHAARAAGLALPATDDPDYASLDALLRHVLGAARHYMTWICTQLDLPDPGIDPTPEASALAADADAYAEHILERWRLPLATVPARRLEEDSFAANWGAPFTIDGMLEHAVMHPLRHAHQLRRLMAS